MADAARRWGRRALDFMDAVERLNAPAVVKLFESEINGADFTPICIRRSVPGPMLVWQGLPAVGRPAIWSWPPDKTSLCSGSSDEFGRRFEAPWRDVCKGDFYVPTEQDESTG